MTTAKDQHGVDLDIKDAIEGYERFRLEFDRDKAFFKSLATKKQKPRLLWIGCCDSRVVPSQITSADPGELFEVRNIANCVPPANAGDDTVGAAIEYALAHLGVDDIVVCGHSGCGGIQALAGPTRRISSRISRAGSSTRGRLMTSCERRACLSPKSCLRPSRRTSNSSSTI